MKPGARHSLILAIPGVCLWIAFGCVTRQPEPPQVVVSAPPSKATVVRAVAGEWVSNHYTDLPIPKSYEYKPDESFVFVQEGLRSADLRYEGDLGVEGLIRFYQDSMPPKGWKFLRLTGMKMKTLTFTKADEICEIIIMTAHAQRVEEDEWQSSDRVSTHLHIKVNPL